MTSPDLITNFVEKSLTEDPTSSYTSKRFRTPKSEESDIVGIGRLLMAVKTMGSSCATFPKEYAEMVSEKNVGETAIQRALYASTAAIIMPNGNEETVEWLDMELPVVLASGGRKPCIDLIGQIGAQKALRLVELKYSRTPASANGNDPDYAIFEVLLYLAAVMSNHESLSEKKVGHSNAKLTAHLDWRKLALTTEVIVVANESFWLKARTSGNQKRIAALCDNALGTCGVRVFLRSFEDTWSLQPRATGEGKYLPRFQSPGPVKLIKVFERDE